MNFKLWLEKYTRRVVLVATGAYNPIHRGHVQVFYHAKRFLTLKGYDVEAAYLIPRNHEYIGIKSAATGEDPLPDEHRQAMIRAAVQGTFIQVLPLEQDRANLNQHQIRAEVQQLHSDAEVIFVAGDDKATCPGEAETCLMDDPLWGKVIIVGRKLAGNASSTMVRTNLKKAGDEPKLLSPAVRGYVRKHQLWGAS